MNQLTIFVALLLVPLAALHAAETTAAQPIDRETLDKWSAPYRGWHYHPEHVIPANPNIPGHADFKNTDVPCVYQLPGQPDKWFMSFIAFNGKGYNSFVAESTDLLKWTNPRLAKTFYLYYCATGDKGRGIGLITSKPLSSKPPPTTDDEAGAATPKSRVFDARAFGVKSDDATDNTEAFSRCLKAVVEAGGGRVVLPDGVYRGRMIIPPVSRPSPSWITVEITGEHEPTHVFGTIGTLGQNPAL